MAFAKQMTVGGLAALYFTDSKPSESGFESERKKEPIDMEISRTAEAEWNRFLLTRWYPPQSAAPTAPPNGELIKKENRKNLFS